MDDRHSEASIKSEPMDLSRNCSPLLKINAYPIQETSEVQPTLISSQNRREKQGNVLEEQNHAIKG